VLAKALSAAALGRGEGRDFEGRWRLRGVVRRPARGGGGGCLGLAPPAHWSRALAREARGDVAAARAGRLAPAAELASFSVARRSSRHR
jgi:hypothetical protein